MTEEKREILKAELIEKMRGKFAGKEITVLPAIVIPSLEMDHVVFRAEYEAEDFSEFDHKPVFKTLTANSSDKEIAGTAIGITTFSKVAVNQIRDEIERSGFAEVLVDF